MVVASLYSVHIPIPSAVYAGRDSSLRDKMITHALAHARGEGLHPLPDSEQPSGKPGISYSELMLDEPERGLFKGDVMCRVVFLVHEDPPPETGHFDPETVR